MAESLGEAFIEVLADTSPFGEGLEDGISDALAGVEDEVAGALSGVGDAADGAFDGIGDAAAGAADDVGEAFEGVGDTIASEVASGVEEAEGSLGGFTDALGSMQGALATAAGGAGLEGFARSQQDATLSVQRGAERVGETEDAVRGMIDGITDWTFSSADAAAGMELLNQRGVDNLDTIEKLLPEWDNFADATGQDFVKAMDDGQRALGAFNIPAEDAGEHMDTLTFMTNEVNVPMDRLARQVRGNEEELDALGIGLDDTAGLLAAMGANGMDGRDAVALFGREIGNADGDLDTLLDSLGLTADEFEEYTGKVRDAEGITQRQADQANDLATPMERLGGWVENVAFKFGDLGQTAGMLAAPLGALGPAMFGLNQASSVFAKVGPVMGKALGGVTKAFNVLRVAILTNPLFLIGALIIGIIAVIWYFRDEIMAALGAAWDWIKDTAGAVWEWLSDTVSEAVDWIVEFVGGLRDRVVEFFQAMVDFVLEYHPIAIAFRLVQEYVPRIIEWIQDLVERVVETVTEWVESVVEWVTNLWERWTSLVHSIRDAVIEAVAALVANVVSTVAGWVETIVGFVTDLWQRWVNLVHTIRDAVIEAIARLVSRVVSTVTGWVRDLLRFVSDLRRDFTGTIRDLISDVVGFFRELPGRIVRAIGNVGRLLFDVGKDIVQGMIDGIGNMGRAAANAVRDVASGMLSSVKGFFGIGSPSKLFRDEVGAPLMQGVEEGVDRLAPDAIDAIERFANQATSAGEIGDVVTGTAVDQRRGATPREIDPAGAGTAAGVAMGAGQLVEMNVYTVDAERTARQVVRKLRDVAYLSAPFDDDSARGRTTLPGGRR